MGLAILKSNPFKPLSKKEILAKSKIDNADISGIYFLIKNNKIVYIGQSKSIAVRLAGHNHKGFFDCYSYIACNESDLDFMESMYIGIYRPELNKKAVGTMLCVENELEDRQRVFHPETNLPMPMFDELLRAYDDELISQVRLQQRMINRLKRSVRAYKKKLTDLPKTRKVTILGDRITPVDISEYDWVDASDRLPSESGMYFCTLRHRIAFEPDYIKLLQYSKYDEGEIVAGRFSNNQSRAVVTHWLPIPKPKKTKKGLTKHW